MQENLDAITATGTQVVAISYDSVDILQNFAKQSNISFTLLSDPGSKTIHAFGIHNQGGLPHPGTYVIGPDRKVLTAIFLDGYRTRHSPEDLVNVINELEK